MIRPSAGACIAAGAIVALSAALLHAGGILERGFRLVDGSSPIPGHVVAEFATQRWPDTCIPIEYRLNTTLDPIPDPVGTPAVTLADAREAIERAMQSWNEIPTSYIEMRLIGTTDSLAGSGFDYVNEVTFSSNEVVGPSIAGLSRSTFLVDEVDAFDGLDADEDGDIDYRASITTCQDIDGDGDIEMPAGRYPAGTIIENDVKFFPQNARYGDISSDPLAWIDLEGVATHEFGHGHGLAHSAITDTDRRDGGTATMNPGYPITDGSLSLRSLHTDDVAWSSYHYPEGTAVSGPAALQPADVAFTAAYALITGEVRDTDGRPVLGAQPFAVTLDEAIVSSTISGRVRVSLNPDTFGFQLLPPALGIADGRYVLPVPRGVYRIGLESADGFPISSGSQTFTETIGGIYGQLGIAEEFWNGPLESAYEADSGHATPVAALHDRHGIDFVVNASQPVIAVNGDPADDGDSTFLALPPGLVLAVRVPTDRLLALGAGELAIQAGLFGLSPLVEEESRRLPEVMITTGVKGADGTAIIDLARPLARETFLQVQSYELAPMHLRHSRQLGRLVTEALSSSGRDLFAVAVFGNDEHPLAPGTSPVGALFRFPSAQTPRYGETYASFDGGATFISLAVDLFFGLEVSAR